MIYCIEDDNGIRDLIVYTLTASGFEAKGFANSNEFWSAVKEGTPNLILLDIMLPNEDGISILKKIRSDNRTADIPVIMETAKETEYDKVVALDLGADDYLTKPFGMMEMVSRVRAVLRRTSKENKKQDLKLNDLEIDTAKHIVYANGEEINLTLKEYDLLKLFMENIGRAFTRDQLLSSVWGTEYVGETRTVDVHIGTLRTKLGKCGDYIKTVRGVGYRMEDKL
ncbi:winged helix-turn-helix domain-containing protein [uncultured Eubacterium sp.]|uniref:winged helix-turn-helix domain-containing protein n=1 Tax=uncultured Eubacterium sp. TaxID=165185 RepID=UPI0025E94215|nr:response regulator transcription factor [uncultured Eubacterium sp.]